jgi:hypothetical protein
MLALLSKKESFSLSRSLAITLQQELRFASFIDTLPIPA